MEDVQDGKKVSIQDGVTEDPALPTFTKGEGLTLALSAGLKIEPLSIQGIKDISVNTNTVDIVSITLLTSVTVT